MDWGDNGPPLLLVHGDMRTSRSWDAVARDLSQQFHVVAPDARGHGDSDWTARGYTLRERVDDLAAFCEYIGLNDAVGIGHSSGGAVVAFCAQRLPGMFSRLVLLEPLLVLDEAFQRRAASRSRQKRHTWSNRKELHEYLKRQVTARRWRDDVMQDVVNHETRELPDGSIDMKWASATFNWEDRRGDRYDLIPLLRSPAMPVLFLASQQRQASFDELRTMAAATPGLRMVIVNGSGHNMYMERPDSVSRAIRAFALDQALPSSI